MKALLDILGSKSANGFKISRQLETQKTPTWRHIESGTTAKVVRARLLGSKAKVRKLDDAIGDQDVLWFEIPMIDANGVAELDGVQYLEKCTFGHEIIAEVMALFRDAGEQIPFRTELEDYKGAVKGIHYLDE